MNFYSSPAGISALQLQIYEPVNQISFYIIAAVILEAIAVYAWLCRSPLTRVVAFALALRSFWLWALVLVTCSSGVTDKIFWAAVQHLCAIGQLPMDFLIIMYAARQNSQIVKKIAQALVLLTAALGLLLATTGWHGLYWSGIFWDGATFGIVRGPTLSAVLILYYFLSLVYLIYWFILARKTPGLGRWQILVLPADFFFSAFGHIPWIIDQHAGMIPALPLGFLLSGLAWAWIFSALRFFNLMPLAQVQVTRKMNDSLIVIDDEGYIVELNPSARKQFGERTPDLVGGNFLSVFAACPALVEMAASHEAKLEELYLESGYISGYYLVMIEPLTGFGGRSLGKAIVLRDISEQKRVQLQNLEQQKALSIMVERERLGREIHDGAGQQWSYINMQVEAACLLLDKSEPAQAQVLLQRLAEVVRAVHVDIRESITGLRAKLSPAKSSWNPLEEYIQWFRQNNDINVELMVDTNFTVELLAPTTRAQLLRIIQEALTNVRKHAGARNVKVAVRRQGKTVEFRVEDDGRGFDAALAAGKKGCYGIGIMNERAEETGAKLVIESSPYAGPAVVIALPLAKA